MILPSGWVNTSSLELVYSVNAGMFITSNSDFMICPQDCAGFDLYYTLRQSNVASGNPLEMRVSIGKSPN